MPLRLLRRADVLVGTAFSLALLLLSYFRVLDIGMTEVFGFITGGLSVYLTVRENIWLWPTGIVNNVFFGFLFWEQRLFADMALQVVYIVLSILGWYWWLHGGKERTQLPVRRATLLHTFVVLLAVLGFTLWEVRYLTAIKDSAPLWDGLTTALSLGAQYLLTRKLIENWYVWILADLIYIPLFAFKHLYLTAGLNLIFLLLCFAGLSQWWRTYGAGLNAAMPLSAAPALAGSESV